jgi:hypothetical protein
MSTSSISLCLTIQDNPISRRLTIEDTSAPKSVDDTHEKQPKNPMTTTLKNAHIVDNASRIVDSSSVDDNTPSHLASSTVVDDPSRAHLGVVDSPPPTGPICNIIGQRRPAGRAGVPRPAARGDASRRMG